MIEAFRKDRYFWVAFGSLAAFYLLWIIVCSEHPFFWDNILNAKLARYYYSNGLGSLVPPLELDAGHPPLFNLYLAFCWKLFGKTLITSHFALLPFLLFFAWHWTTFSQRFLKGAWILGAVMIPILEPSVLSQSSLISPDIVLIACTFAGVNFILDRQPIALAFTLACMAMVSMRGILSLPVLGLFELWHHRHSLKSWFFKFKWWPWIPVILVIWTWFFLHYNQTGWWLSPPAETYGQHREILGIGGMVKNFAIIGWRFVDQGHLAYFLGIGTLLLLTFRRSKSMVKEVSPLLVFFACFTLVMTMTSLPLSNTVGMRYFMVSFLCLGLFILWLISISDKWKREMIAGVFFGILLYSGHFWIWPDRIAKSWDTTIAHFEWFTARDFASAEIRELQISPERVCSDFPALDDPSVADPGPNQDLYFSSVNESDHRACDYILYSNIMNGFSDELLVELSNEWTPVFSRHRNGVKTILYRNPGLKAR